MQHPHAQTEGKVGAKLDENHLFRIAYGAMARIEEIERLLITAGHTREQGSII